MAKCSCCHGSVAICKAHFSFFNRMHPVENKAWVNYAPVVFASMMCYLFLLQFLILSDTHILPEVSPWVIRAWVGSAWVSSQVGDIGYITNYYQRWTFDPEDFGGKFNLSWISTTAKCTDWLESFLCSHTTISNWLSNLAFSFEKNMWKALAITFSSFAPTLFISYVFKDCRDIFIASKVPALPRLIELIRRILENSQDFSLLSIFVPVQSLLTDISNYVALPWYLAAVIQLQCF